MRIEGHPNHPHTTQRRVDAEHAQGAAKTTSSSSRGRGLSQSSSIFPSRSKLIGKLQEVPQIRTDEVRRVADNLRLGVYTTRQAAQQTAAAIMADPQRMV
jgi:hypothetical protein